MADRRAHRDAFPEPKFVVDNPSRRGQPWHSLARQVRDDVLDGHLPLGVRGDRARGARATQPPRLRASRGGRRVAPPRRVVPRPRLALDRDPPLGSAPGDPPRTRLRCRARSLLRRACSRRRRGHRRDHRHDQHRQGTRARAPTPSRESTIRPMRIPRGEPLPTERPARRDAIERDHSARARVPDGTPPPLPLVVASPLSHSPFPVPPPPLVPPGHLRRGRFLPSLGVRAGRHGARHRVPRVFSGVRPRGASHARQGAGDARRG